MTAPTLSIIMPVYNAEAYLREAVESILAQSFTDFELIIVEDGSTDNSREVIEGFNDSRIQVLYNDGNQGIVFTRNRGMAAARGRYIAPFDADDIAHPEKFAKQIQFLEENPEYGMVGSWVKLIDKSGKEMSEDYKLNAPHEQIPPIMLFRNYFVQSSVLMRREAIPPGGYEKGFDIGEDYRMWTIIANKWKVWNYPKYLIEYRVHHKGITKRESDLTPLYDNKVFRPLYETLNINLNEHQCRLLQQIKSDMRIADINTLKDIERFLLHILKQNARLLVYDQKQLRKVVKNRWLKVCIQANLPMHRRVGVYLGSSVVWNKTELEARSPKLEGGIDNPTNKPTSDVSIIAANYNNGRYLQAFIRSVMDSTVLPRELIIVDDGSTDDSYETLLDHTELPYLKIIYFDQNRGFTAALNAALEAASCKYIMRADPDDLLMPDRIEKQFTFLERNPEIDILGSNAVYFSDENGRHLNRTNFPGGHKAIVSAYRKGEHGLLHATVCGKREVYQQYRYQPLSPGEDYELFARMVKDGRRFAALNEVLYKVRVHRESASSQISRVAIERTFRFRDQIFGTRTSGFKIWRYWNHIRFYRKSLQSENPIKRYSILALSALFYPGRLLNRLFKG